MKHKADDAFGFKILINETLQHKTHRIFHCHPTIVRKHYLVKNTIKFLIKETYSTQSISLSSNRICNFAFTTHTTHHQTQNSFTDDEQETLVIYGFFYYCLPIGPHRVSFIIFSLPLFFFLILLYNVDSNVLCVQIERCLS